MHRNKGAGRLCTLKQRPCKKKGSGSLFPVKRIRNRAKRRVLVVSSQLSEAGLMAAIITVFEFPASAFLSRNVSLEFLKGAAAAFFLPPASAAITIANVDKLLLMAAPSFRVAPPAPVFLARSEPAKSTMLISDRDFTPFPWSCLNTTVKIQWEREDTAFI